MMKKLLCACLALIMMMSCAAFAQEDLQAQLYAANATIEELQALVDTYYPYYQAQIVATYGEDGIVWLADAQEAYEEYASMYSSYGIDLEAYGLADGFKMQVVEEAVLAGVLHDKAIELGLVDLEAEAETLAAEAQAEMQYYIDYYLDYYYADTVVTEEMTAEAEAYWTSVGISADRLMVDLEQTLIVNAIYDYIADGITLTEEDIQAEYEALLASDQETYTDAYSYIDDRTYGETIAWNPEGYRTVKQILIMFDDEQSAQYSELQATLTALEEELAALETEEATEETRTAEEINTDIANCAAAIEALYSTLLPEAQEVVEKFNNGESFEDLMVEHNDDTGMTREPAASQGYTICAEEVYWDPTFIEGAMSIEEKGQISEPMYGSYGIYIIYYLDDITPGAVALEEIREGVEAIALDNKVYEAYEAQSAAWLEEANIEYFYENFGIAM